MPNQAHGVLIHAMSGTELSRVRTEFRLRLPERINKSPLESRGRHCYAIKWNLAASAVVGCCCEYFLGAGMGAGRGARMALIFL